MANSAHLASSFNTVGQVLKPEYEMRLLRFANGQTWFRIVPVEREAEECAPEGI